MTLEEIKKISEEEVLFWVLCNINNTSFISKLNLIVRPNNDPILNTVSQEFKEADRFARMK
jgi:hypothetical protein